MNHLVDNLGKRVILWDEYPGTIDALLYCPPRFEVALDKGARVAVDPDDVREIGDAED